MQVATYEVHTFLSQSLMILLIHVHCDEYDFGSMHFSVKYFSRLCPLMHFDLCPFFCYNNN